MSAVLENPGDLPGGVCVQVAGGLIREDDRRLGDQSPGDGHPLLLPPERVAIRRRASSGVSPSCSKRGRGWGFQTGPRFLPG